MKTFKLAILSLGFFIGGIWLTGLIGNPSITDNTAMLGRLLALIMGAFCAGAIHMIWAPAADRADFEAYLARDLKNGKLRQGTQSKDKSSQ